MKSFRYYSVVIDRFNDLICTPLSCIILLVFYRSVNLLYSIRC